MKQREAIRKRLAVLALALTLCLHICVPASAEGTKNLPDTAKEAAESALTYGQATSISWAVWQDGKIIESGSQKSPQAPHADLPAGSAYCIGSVSKMYTTAAVMQLADAGKLELDKPVTTYLPEFKMADPRYKDITVRMLLNHSSGLMGSSMGSALLFDDDCDEGTSQLLERLATQRLKADPGAYSVYCNDGFTLAQLVVEAVSGQGLMEYLRANILQPLSLTHTYAPGEEFDHAEIYQTGDPRPLPTDCLGVLGAGGIYATAEDLAAFGGALTGDGVISGEALDAMAAPEYKKGVWPEEAPDSLAFGLGWDNVNWYPFSQSKIKALVKGGDTQYYHAGLVVLPEHGMAAAVLSAGGVSTYNEMAASQMLVSALSAEGVSVDQRPITLPAAKPAPMPAELLENAGYYGSIMPYLVEVSKDGTLTMNYLSRPDVPPQSFTYHDDGTFRDKDGTASLQFVKEENGQTYLYQKAFTQLPGLGGLPTANYAAVKLPKNDVSKDVQTAWDTAMTSVNLFPMNERYSSQIYLAIASAGTEFDSETESIPGYVSALQIVDESNAAYVIQVPGNVGRDGYDIKTERDQNGVFWMYTSNGAVYMDASAAPEISTGQNNASRCTIQPDGYARWYKIGSAAGKTMAVQMPEDAGFWVYDAKGQVAASSVLWDDASSTLPTDGYIAFAGDPGAVFSLTFS